MPSESRGLGGVESLSATALSVEIWDPGGLRLNTLAVVTLLNSAGKKIGSKLTVGSIAVFTPLNSGSYFLDVEAPGFANAHIPAKIVEGKQSLRITLQPSTSSDVGTIPGGPLSAKAQKEIEKGSAAFRANDFDAAAKHLDAARTLAPDDPDVLYTLGLIWERKHNQGSAAKYWSEALKSDPRHVSSLLAMGQMALKSDDATGAREYLDKAVEYAPDSWQAHSLLAEALLRQRSYPEAVTHSQRAIDLGKAQGEGSLLVLGQALAAEHQNADAIKALQTYLLSKPTEDLVKFANGLIVRLQQNSEASETGTSDQVDEHSPEPLLSSSAMAAARSWLPPNVDDGVPPVEPELSCSLEDVLKKAALQAQALPHLVDRYSATEVLRHEDIDASGVTQHIENLSFNYLAAIQETKSEYGNFLNVEEYRNGSIGESMFPNQMATKGLPSIALIFHPWLADDFTMKCEGLGRVGSHFAWQIYFRQRDDKESRIRRYRINGRRFPVALKGRAWIDADTFQVVRMETDLREPYPGIKLSAEHLALDYGPVEFPSRKEVLWLPSTAEYYSVFHGRRVHRRHTFTNYVLFSVDEQQKITVPPVPTDSDQTPPPTKPPLR
ncbi:MAG TPA: tetratricopeptide repeat protein [Candidatus Acidoferrum sp.]